MVRTHPPTSSSTADQSETAVVISFTESTDGTQRRVRYLTRGEEETMWRVEERRRTDDWEVVDAELVEGLQVSLPNSAPEGDRQAAPVV